jgi:phycoerythrin-associated linker protein
VIQKTPTAVVSPASAGAAFRGSSTATSRQRQGVGASSDGKVYRIEVTAYRAKSVKPVSQFRRSNQVYLVPFDQLSTTYQRIHRQGGVIASISAV